MCHVQIPPEFDNEFFRMSESEIQEFINGQQNKNTLQKTVRDVAMATQFLKLKNETRELHKIEPTELDLF
jgi:fructose-1-phosphate kinase PfkB-like protein